MSDYLRELEKEEKRHHKDMNEGKRVLEMTETQGWGEIIEPILEKMIVDVVGGKWRGRWTKGALSKANSEDRRSYYVGYKDALITFHNMVVMYVDKIEKAEAALARVQEERDAGYRLPMQDDPYSPEEGWG